MASVASRVRSGAACSSSGRSRSVKSSKSGSRGSSLSYSLLVDRSPPPLSSPPLSASATARGFLRRASSLRFQASALGFSLTSSRLAHDTWGKTSSKRGRVPVRSAPIDGDDGATTTTTTATTASSSTTSSAAASEKLLALLSAAPDRGVYGLPSEQKQAILLAIAELEKLDGGGGGESGGGEAPPSVSERLPALAGRWRVLFSTVTITGSRRVKLGLKTAVSITDLVQEIDPGTGTASSEVAFELRFLGGGGSGSLRLEAAFAVSGRDHPRRVDISLRSAALTPPALESLLGQHMALLLSIFNPEGWLETTFADERLRVGRDDKGRVFVLERVV